MGKTMEKAMGNYEGKRRQICSRKGFHFAAAGGAASGPAQLHSALSIVIDTIDI